MPAPTASRWDRVRNSLYTVRRGSDPAPTPASGEAPPAKGAGSRAAGGGGGAKRKPALWKGLIQIIAPDASTVNNPLDAEGWRALHFGAKGGNSHITHSLLEAGADVDARTSAGRTPLMVAAFCDHTEVAYLLLRHGADPLLTDAPSPSSTTGPNPGQTASDIAHHAGHVMTARLVDHWAWLHWAATSGASATPPLPQAALQALAHCAHRMPLTDAAAAPRPPAPLTEGGGGEAPAAEVALRHELARLACVLQLHRRLAKEKAARSAAAAAVSAGGEAPGGTAEFISGVEETMRVERELDERHLEDVELLQGGVAALPDPPAHPQQRRGSGSQQQQQQQHAAALRQMKQSSEQRLATEVKQLEDAVLETTRHCSELRVYDLLLVAEERARGEGRADRAQWWWTPASITSLEHAARHAIRLRFEGAREDILEASSRHATLQEERASRTHLLHSGFHIPRLLLEEAGARRGIAGGEATSALAIAESGCFAETARYKSYVQQAYHSLQRGELCAAESSCRRDVSERESFVRSFEVEGEVAWGIAQYHERQSCVASEGSTRLFTAESNERWFIEEACWPRQTWLLLRGFHIGQRGIAWLEARRGCVSEVEEESLRGVAELCESSARGVLSAEEAVCRRVALRLTRRHIKQQRGVQELCLMSGFDSGGLFSQRGDFCRQADGYLQDLRRRAAAVVLNATHESAERARLWGSEAHQRKFLSASMLAQRREAVNRGFLAKEAGFCLGKLMHQAAHPPMMPSQVRYLILRTVGMVVYRHAFAVWRAFTFRRIVLGKQLSVILIGSAWHLMRNAYLRWGRYVRRGRHRRGLAHRLQQGMAQFAAVGVRRRYFTKLLAFSAARCAVRSHPYLALLCQASVGEGGGTSPLQPPLLFLRHFAEHGAAAAATGRPVPLPGGVSVGRGGGVSGVSRGGPAAHRAARPAAGGAGAASRVRFAPVGGVEMEVGVAAAAAQPPCGGVGCLLLAAHRARVVPKREGGVRRGGGQTKRVRLGPAVTVAAGVPPGVPSAGRGVAGVPQQHAGCTPLPAPLPLPGSRGRGRGVPADAPWRQTQQRQAAAVPRTLAPLEHRPKQHQRLGGVGGGGGGRHASVPQPKQPHRRLAPLPGSGYRGGGSAPAAARKHPYKASSSSSGRQQEGRAAAAGRPCGDAAATSSSLARAALSMMLQRQGEEMQASMRATFL